MLRQRLKVIGSVAGACLGKSYTLLANAWQTAAYMGISIAGMMLGAYVAERAMAFMISIASRHVEA